ncbi:MAG: hypothetical protein HY506_01245 [Candidatus Yanofskybacteria bacterium]|nr:hypothetical protein [Candidatus Yanofskybacteria bacterium]
MPDIKLTLARSIGVILIVVSTFASLLFGSIWFSLGWFVVAFIFSLCTLEEKVVSLIFFAVSSIYVLFLLMILAGWRGLLDYRTGAEGPLWSVFAIGLALCYFWSKSLVERGEEKKQAEQ